MTGTCITAHRNANVGKFTLGPKRSHFGTVPDAVREMFPEDTRETLKELLNLSESAAKKKLEGDRAFSDTQLCCLLNHERGYILLRALTAGSSARWVKILGPLMEAADIQVMTALVKRRSQRLVNLVAADAAEVAGQMESSVAAIALGYAGLGSNEGRAGL
jgi:hypothetical protein